MSHGRMLLRETLRAASAGTFRIGFRDQMAEIEALRDSRNRTDSRASIVPLKPNVTITFSDNGMLTNPSPESESRSGYIVDTFLPMQRCEGSSAGQSIANKKRKHRARWACSALATAPLAGAGRRIASKSAGMIERDCQFRAV